MVRTYTYPTTSNRLSSVKQGTTTTRAFAYDAAGNTVTDTRGTSAYNYAINSAGRIRTLSVGAALKSTYTYDAFHRLRVKALTSPVSTTHYIWDSFGHIIAEHNGTGGAVQKDYVWLGDTPLANINAGIHNSSSSPAFILAKVWNLPLFCWIPVVNLMSHLAMPTSYIPTEDRNKIFQNNYLGWYEIRLFSRNSCGHVFLQPIAPANSVYIQLENSAR